MSNIDLAERKNFVGASEVASLFGVGFASRWELWLQKTGRIEPEDLSANEHVQAGKFLEPAIASWAADKWGMKIRKVRRYCPHPHIKGFGASLDYESQEGALIPVEIKWSGFAREGDGWIIEGDEIKDAPLRYLLQVQAQMACTGAAYAWLILLSGSKICRMKIDMHRETVARIENEVEEFWLSVEQAKEPKPDFTQDSALIAELMQVTADSIVDLTHNNRLPILCTEYLAGCEVEKEGKKEKEAALAEIRVILAEHGGPQIALCNGYKISSSIVPEAAMNYVRKSYAVTRISAQKEKEKAA